MRELTVYANSTPSFQFTITDATDAGLDLQKYAIGMSIWDENSKVLILPDYVNGVATTFWDVEGTLVKRHAGYCSYKGNGKYNITIPFLPSLSGQYTYEVFLFSVSQEVAEEEIVGEEEERTTSNAITRYRVVVIDAGTIEFAESGIPSIEAKREQEFV